MGGGVGVDRRRVAGLRWRGPPRRMTTCLIVRLGLIHNTLKFIGKSCKDHIFFFTECGAWLMIIVYQRPQVWTFLATGLILSPRRVKRQTAGRCFEVASQPQSEGVGVVLYFVTGFGAQPFEKAGQAPKLRASAAAGPGGASGLQLLLSDSLIALQVLEKARFGLVSAGALPTRSSGSPS
jgi:hypothetical protein